MSLSNTSSDELLQQAHVSLLADLQQLNGATAAIDLPALQRRLLRTRHDLVQHFHLEEQHGYLDAVRAREPCLEPTLTRLLGEHRKLLQDLDAILAQLEQSRPSPEVIQQLVRLWVHDVRGHEIRENDLIQDAFVHDLGLGD